MVTFACLEKVANQFMLINITWLKTCLKEFNSRCFRLMSPYFLWSLACLDRDLFYHDGSVLLSIVAQALLLYIFCVQMWIFLVLAMPTRDASGRSRLMRVGSRTRTYNRLRVAEEGILFYGEENVLTLEKPLPQTMFYLMKHLLVVSLVNMKLMCNNFT
jgi:hypothetical protein